MSGSHRLHGEWNAPDTMRWCVFCNEWVKEADWDEHVNNLAEAHT